MSILSMLSGGMSDSIKKKLISDFTSKFRESGIEQILLKLKPDGSVDFIELDKKDVVVNSENYNFLLEFYELNKPKI